MVNINENKQMIEVPLRVGSRVSILSDVSMDDGGFSASTDYEATVEQYVPETRLLVMSDGTGYAEMCEMLKDAESVQIIREK